LDAAEPLRQFSFILNVNNQDVYEILRCDPALPEEALDGILQGFNSIDNWSDFIRSMSK